MQNSQSCELLATCSQQVNLDLTTIDCACLALDKACFLAARYQGNDTVRLRLQSLGDLADGCPLAPLETLAMQHQLVLQNSDALPPRSFLTEPQEDAQAEAEIRESLETLFLACALFVRHRWCTEWILECTSVQVLALRAGKSHHDINIPTLRCIQIGSHQAVAPGDSLMEQMSSSSSLSLRTPNTEHRTPNTEHRTPNTEHRAVGLQAAIDYMNAHNPLCMLITSNWTELEAVRWGNNARTDAPQ